MRQGAFLLLFLLGVTGTAEAQSSPGSRDAPTNHVEERWYGWQIIIPDALGYAGVASGLITETRALAFAGAGSYWLGAPTVHLLHDRVGAAAASFGLRSVTIALGSGALLCFDNQGDDEATNPWCPVLALTSIASAVPAIALDQTLLAYEEVDIPTTTVSPWIDPARGSAGVGVYGRF